MFVDKVFIDCITYICIDYNEILRNPLRRLPPISPAF